jgi:dopamine D2-like receptor
MRHATSWRKNQSGDDAFNRLLETSNTTNTVDIILLFFYFSTRTTTNTNQIKFETKLRQQNHIKYISIHHQQILVYLFTCISYSFSNMQHLSNDTGSWNLIVAPPPSSSSLLYNSNAYDGSLPSSATIHHPILSNPSLASPHTVTIETTSVNYWAFILIIFPLFTIFGNILVVISVYREKSLHTVTNYFVVSLAISDITVAAVVMPFAIYLEVSLNN